jgi:hypothetical protein
LGAQDVDNRRSDRDHGRRLSLNPFLRQTFLTAAAAPQNRAPRARPPPARRAVPFALPASAVSRQRHTGSSFSTPIGPAVPPNPRLSCAHPAVSPGSRGSVLPPCSFLSVHPFLVKSFRTVGVAGHIGLPPHSAWHRGESPNGLTRPSFSPLPPAVRLAAATPPSDDDVTI